MLPEFTYLAHINPIFLKKNHAGQMAVFKLKLQISRNGGKEAEGLSLSETRKTALSQIV